MNKFGSWIKWISLTLILSMALPLQAFAAAAYKPVELRSTLQKEMAYYNTTEFAALPVSQEVNEAFQTSLEIPDNVELLKSIGDAHVKAFARDGDTLWAGTDRGVIRFNFKEKDKADYVQYMNGPRYLYNSTGGNDSDIVTGLASDGNNGIWIRNVNGVVHVTMTERTLKGKADIYEEMTRAIIDRRGMTSDGPYQIVDGAYVGNPGTKDNDGLWTAEYVLGEIYRYMTAKKENNTTEMAKAKEAATRGAKAVMLLSSIAGRGDGFPARSYVINDPNNPLNERNTISGGLWFEKTGVEIDGKKYAVAVKSKDSVKASKYIVDEAHAEEAKAAYLTATGRSYESDYGEQVSPVVLDKNNSNNVVWQLKSEIKEELDPMLSKLYTDEGYTDQQVIYKADTSSDEVVGHFLLFYYAGRYLFDGTGAEDEHLKKLTIEFADRMMHHIVTSGFILKDATGLSTSWSKWFAEYYWEWEGHDPANGHAYGYEDAPLNSIELMSFLKSSIYLTSLDETYSEHNALYRQVYDDLWNRDYDPEVDGDGKGYIRMAEDYIRRRLNIVDVEFEGYEGMQGILDRRDWPLTINYSDENLFSLSFLPLIDNELQENPDSQRVTDLRRILDDWWINMEREKNPLYTFIYQYTNQHKANVDLQGASWFLYRLPQVQNNMASNNFYRDDVLLLADYNMRDDDNYQTNRRLAPDETRLIKFNNNPFVVWENVTNQDMSTPELVTYNGTNYNSGSMYSSTWFTLPYWMGRYYGMMQGE
ncbi:hypothetical protein [Paenibacillus eucommiae]|uniref:Uncharacterized protein n=1 Tax=Paenibacillus eucommiae TaxID=1355755 RepID=A0ABS4IMN8_9BACL|nr:hypothetical protein [Paenibacillus eucommiae]MBP1988804.1 hypothetical protein [Paenibacillus eucommiae]